MKDPEQEGRRSTRRHTGLLGFLLKGEADAIFRQNPFELEDPARALADVWRHSSRARSSLQPLEESDLHPLPEELQGEAAAVRNRGDFARHYEGVADYTFAMATVDQLLTPQWSADIQYVGELMTRLGDISTGVDVFAFCMPRGAVPAPIIAGNTVLFSSPRPDLFAHPVPEIRETDEGDFEIVVQASSRGNLVQVVQYRNRLVLANGVHKVLALYQKGVKEVPCVARQAQSLGEIQFPQALQMFQPSIIDGPRPALVVDLLDPDISTHFITASTVQILRVSIGVDSITAPFPTS